jgi:hypothetical protein
LSNVLDPAVAAELGTAVMATPPLVTAEGVRTELLVSSVARLTSRMRFVPVPTVWDQVTELALVAVLVATES